MSDPDDVAGLVLNAVVSHAQATGRFERVNAHESLHPSTGGLTAAVWVDRIDPIARASGLAATSARLIVKVRVHSSMQMEPRDAIDPAVTAAVWALMRVLTADYDLGGTVRNIDILNEFGVAMFAQAGYLDWDDGAMDRITDLTVPVIINDVWPQAA